MLYHPTESNKTFTQKGSQTTVVMSEGNRAETGKFSLIWIYLDYNKQTGKSNVVLLAGKNLNNLCDSTRTVHIL